METTTCEDRRKRDLKRERGGGAQKAKREVSLPIPNGSVPSSSSESEAELFLGADRCSHELLLRDPSDHHRYRQLHGSRAPHVCMG